MDEKVLALSTLAAELEWGARYMLGLPNGVPDVFAVAGTASSVCLAATVITGVASLALTTMVERTTASQLEQHAFHFDKLLTVLGNTREEHGPTFAELRAGPLAPAVIITCLIRMLGSRKRAMESGRV